MIPVPPLLLLAWLALLSPARQSSTSWAWFRATSVIDKWWITEGRARVTIEGNLFRAALWDSDDTTFARVSLEGSIQSTSVTVTVTVNATDLEPYRASGTLTRACWKQGGGRETIILTSGFDAIGLVRELPRTSPCAGA